MLFCVFICALCTRYSYNIIRGRNQISVATCCVIVAVLCGAFGRNFSILARCCDLYVQEVRCGEYAPRFPAGDDQK